MIKFLKEADICVSQNSLLVKVVGILVGKISDKSEYINHFHKLLGILNKLCHMNYFHQEHIMNKIRKTIKNIYNNNKIISEFKNLLIDKKITLKRRKL